MDRRKILLIAAVLIAALGAVLVFVYVKSADDRAKQNYEMKTVMVAVAKIDAGENIDDAEAAGKVQPTELPATSVVDGSMTTTDGIKGMVANATIYPGEQLLAGKFGGSGTTSTLPIPKGKMAATVNLTDANRVADFVAPGSEVSVFCLVGAGTDENATVRVLIERASVLGVGSTSTVSKTTTKKDGTQTTEELPRTLMTLALDQKQTESVLLCNEENYTNVKLAFSLVNDDSKISADDGTTPENLFKQ